jgi:hypothetical protein
VVAGQCCDDDLNFNDVYCCPSQSGRPSLATTGTLFCPASPPGPNPPTATNCWVRNADCSNIGGVATGCCCFSFELARTIANGPALPAIIPCCNAGTQTQNIYYFVSNNDCCPANQVTSNFRGTNPSGSDTAYCCPTTIGSLGVTVAGITCSFFQTVNDANNNAVTCCRNCDVSRDPVSGAISTSTNARCCPSNAAQTPTLVDIVANSASQFNRYCCPKANVFTTGGQTVCCPQPIAIVPIAKFIGGTCCQANQDVINANSGAEVCCPGYDPSSGVPPVWADLGGGLISGTCCPVNQALTFTTLVPAGAALPNVPASVAQGAPSPRPSTASAAL